ncbi:hypothetical protein, partial [uncultured Amnibacterium sp.]|uniref:hypothetical protein n=1 Tax=uncultured Amnibacterium sp. TaxID=1631851 RepID=UPI0035C9B3E7
MKAPYKALAIEWDVCVSGHPEPTAVIRRLTLQGVERFRAVTWAPSSTGRELIGYFAEEGEQGGRVRAVPGVGTKVPVW